MQPIAPKPEFPLLTPAFYNTRLGERFANHLRVFLATELQVDQSSIALSLFNALSWTLTSIVNTQVPYTQRQGKKLLLRELYAGLRVMTDDLARWIPDETQDSKRPKA